LARKLLWGQHSIGELMSHNERLWIIIALLAGAIVSVGVAGRLDQRPNAS
jgi:hypothetical protein